MKRDYITYALLLCDYHKNLFVVGEKVKHLYFGEGEVLEVDLENASYLIKFI